MRSCDVFSCKDFLLYLAYIVYFATSFELFLTKFWSMKPMISILFEELEQLLWNLMTKFVELKYLQEEVNRKEKVS